MDGLIMKKFIYTYSEGKAPRDGSGILKSCVIYKITRDDVVEVARGYDRFVSEFQLVLDTMEQGKLLPKKAFARNPESNGRLFASAWALKQAGFASVTRV